MLFQLTALRLSRNSRLPWVAMTRGLNKPSVYTNRLAKLANRHKIEEEGQAPIWVNVDQDIAQHSTARVGTSDDVNRYEGLALMTLQSLLKRRGMLHSLKGGTTVARAIERLQKSDVSLLIRVQL